MNSTRGFIYSVTEWITRFAYVNLLWILFSLLGAVVFGLFPATTAMFAVTRQWLRGNTDEPVLKTFWDYYRKDFWKSNVVGLFVAGIAALIAIDILFIQANGGSGLGWTNVPLFAFMLLFLLFLFFLFPTFVHFDMKPGKVIKNAFLLMLVNPLHSVIILLCLVPLFFIMQLVPALAVIFGGSLYAFITMWVCLQAFDKAHQKSGQVSSE